MASIWQKMIALSFVNRRSTLSRYDVPPTIIVTRVKHVREYPGTQQARVRERRIHMDT